MYDLPTDYRKLNYKQRREVRLQYIDEQDGICPHCGNPLDGPPSDEMFEYWINKRLFPKNFFKYPVHLHHDHETGMTIAAVHSLCNAVLWQYHGE